jgi:hypothetical protein
MDSHFRGNDNYKETLLSVVARKLPNLNLGHGFKIEGITTTNDRF